MGTLYRRFPTKDALIAALVQDVMTTLLALARECAESPDGTGLERFLEAASAYQAAHRGCLPRLWTAGTEHESIRGVIETTRGAAPDAWRRHLDILMAGLRPAPEPLPHACCPRRQSHRVM